ncbi:carbamoyl phosphate synthase small subunit [Pseudalkalibacillus hwajinpoensis]|uniref:Carbamoyl phosphate synthase small chain n=1 Tax=Guptibacillus hwajinpoensis TaxID=208199 RepID=A0A4V5PYU3_9BACL|nr:carbamoyl phosphate synthase small subunit [Pseudalkalibacillus hwajinpoensis]TKD71458.1 carbamoyl phosphate synthase small subunit [Pseudalkalibacillus hwajinpoensis]
MKKGYLALENGAVFEGVLIGDLEATGEVVFNTSMTGYQEIVTDPSYAGQIIVFCYPQIGNYGMNDFDSESEHLHLHGVVTGEQCETPSHYLSNNSFSNGLAQKHIPSLTGVDTRALVKMLRDHGTMKGKILTELPVAEIDWRLGESYVPLVSVKEFKHFPNNGPHIVLIDFGYKKSILTALQSIGCAVTVVPYNTTLDQLLDLNPDGVVLSNGPGNPEALSASYETIRIISEMYPVFGICLGHQLLALAHGASTRKLSFGHRGSNHPVKHVETGKVYITSQNHGYEVVQDSLIDTGFKPTFMNLNDGTVEGLMHVKYNIQSVQFHPEAHAGPSDTAYLFDDFLQQITRTGDQHYAFT